MADNCQSLLEAVSPLRECFPSPKPHTGVMLLEGAALFLVPDSPVILSSELEPLMQVFRECVEYSHFCHFPRSGLAPEVLGNLCLAVQEAEGLAMKVILHTFEHVLQSAACFYFSWAGAFHLHSCCAKKCLLLQEIASGIAAVATAVVGTCFCCGNW